MPTRVSAVARPKPATRRLRVPEAVKEKGRHYRWVNWQKGMVDIRKEQGYAFVEKQDVEDDSVGDNGIPGSAIVAGSLVLMSCPKKLHERRNKQRRAYNEIFHNQSFEQFKTKAASMGVEVEDESRVERGPLKEGE